ncbi:sensor histidine kinase [Spirosoma sp. BT702]|uniref:Sensor histidine kinase n=1 Tax=Spirosoma profusum TaxID=2771354 RepID=A0A926Y5I2_9BACT|nr:histidine kinase [Spirosoma profusum]MBD2704601.1 sensor histidine kinase [Spirosoma profusum]
MRSFFTRLIHSRLGWHLLLWIVTFSVFFLSHVRLLPTITKTVHVGLLLLPYRLALIYGALYWVLPPALRKESRLFISRLVIYLLVGMLLGFFWIGYVLYPYDTGQLLLFPGKQVIFNFTAWTNGLLLVGIVVSIELYRFWYSRERANQQLANETLMISLQVLKAQVHPHFLFNTLNNVYSLALKESPLAPDMVQKLSGLLGYMIHECNTPTVLLTNEIQFLRNYIDLEKLRYGPRLQINTTIHGDSDAHQIAPLLLMPFVENAFKHGAAKQIGSAQIEVALFVANDQLTFKVHNSLDSSFAGLPNGVGGIGLSNVQKRLSLLYPSTHSLTIRPETDRFTIELTLLLNPKLSQLPTMTALN